MEISMRKFPATVDRSGADQILLNLLRNQVKSSILEALNGARSCSLVGFPNHNNSGDSAIWLGERAILRELGVRVNYVCDDASYSPQDLRKHTSNADPILIHGGGNYGDLWPQQQAFREAVLSNHGNRSIVQLPQTLDFRNRASAEEHRKLLARRTGPFLLLCRDDESLRLAKDELSTEAALCPDPAFSLSTNSQPSPTHDVVLNLRTDHETSSIPVPNLEPLRVRTVDWFDTPPSRRTLRRVTVRVRTHVRALASAVSSDDFIGERVRRGPTLGADFFAARRVQNALRMLSSGRVVVTDRLHGHILATLLGIPHVVLDTRSRKIARFHKTFTRNSNITLVAATTVEVPKLAAKLLERMSEGVGEELKF